MNIIEVHHLSKAYQKQWAITDVTFSVSKGEIFGFIGPNGAGKSTTIKAMLDFIKPDRGTVQMFGLDSQTQAKAIRQKTSYVSSDVRLYPDMTSEDLMQFVAKYHQIDPATRTKKLAYYQELFEMDLKKKMRYLSLGNKRKTALACGLLTDPELLILDEPTNGLDPLMQHRFYEELKRHQQQGMTIFLSSHDLSEVQKQADRAAFIKEGKLLTIEEMTTQVGKVITVKGQALKTQAIDAIGGQILEQSTTQLRFWYEGERAPLFTYLNRSEITDFTIAEPNLEDRFLTLYEKEATE